MGAVKDNTIVVIPSYNEARSIGSVVDSIADMGLNVLVIDDGSTDNTERIALDNGAMVKRHRYNIGKGYSVREGIKYVLSKTNFEWVIIMDADGQHHAEDVPVLMNATMAEDVDLVIGNRMFETKDMPPVRYMTNRFMSWIISRMCGQQIPDTQCGYRLVKTEALKRLKLVSRKYDIESEMLIEAANLGMKMKSVPVRTIYGEEKSAIKPLRDTMKFLALLYRYYFKLNGARVKEGTE